MTLLLYKNGAVYKRLSILHVSGTAQITISGSAWGQANGAGDFFEVFLQHNYGTNRSLLGTADQTWFQGILARPL